MSDPLSPESLISAATGLPVSGTPKEGSLKRKLVIGLLVAGVGLGASFMSCIGQSFSYRQAQALEGIEQQLKEIHASLTERR